MAKPWEKYQATAETDVNAKPWERYAEAPKTRSSDTVVAGRNFVQGATAGFSDEIAGGFEAAGRALGFEGAGGPVKDIKRTSGGMTTDWDVIKDAYIRGRDRERETLAQDQKNAPGIAMTANIAGAVVSPANKLAKGMSLAKGGATIGAVTGAGTSDANSVSGLVRDTATGMVVGAAMGKGAEKAAPYIEKGVAKIADKTKEVGRAIYKSGLKNIDLVSERFGKQPVSDLLIEKGITGSAKEIYKQMDDLGEKLLAERNAILKDATRKGAEVDVRASLKEAQEYVNALRKTDNPESRKAVQMLQGRIDEYLNAAAKEPELITRNLPYTKAEETLIEQAPASGYRAGTEKAVSEVAPGSYIGQSNAERTVYLPKKGGIPGVGESIVDDAADEIVLLPRAMVREQRLVPRSATVLDETERVAGPTPIQVSSWKTTAGNKVGKQAWQQIARSSEGKGFDKALAAGLRRGTEESVEKASGTQAAAALKKKNSDLGRLLTSKERALLDAEIEARKNGFTSVDGILSTHPGILAAKKAADAAKTTAVRTNVGKALMDRSTRISDALQRSRPIAALAEKKPGAFAAIVGHIESSKALPRAADSKDIKGPNKWVADGVAKIDAHGTEILSDADVVKEILESKEGRRLLISASDLKPGSKAMNRIAAQINEKFGKGGR